MNGSVVAMARYFAQRSKKEDVDRRVDDRKRTREGCGQSVRAV